MAREDDPRQDQGRTTGAVRSDRDTAVRHEAADDASPDRDRAVRDESATGTGQERQREPDRVVVREDADDTARTRRAGAVAAPVTADRDAADRDAAERDRAEREEAADREPPAAVKVKTSIAAAVSLALGTAALFAALTAILSPLALIFGILAIVFGLTGLNRAARPGVVGKGVAIAGLALGGLGVLIAAVLLAGAVTVLNDEDQVNRIEQELQDLRENLPTQVPSPG